MNTPALRPVEAPHYDTFENALDPSLAARLLALVEAERHRLGSLLNLHEPAFYTGFHGAAGRTAIATSGDRVVGFALLGFGDAIYPAYRPRLEGLGVPLARMAVLSGCLIDPAWRGLGVGRELTAMLVAHADALGLGYVVVTTHAENHSSWRLLCSLGFESLGQVALPDSGEPRILMGRRSLRKVAHG
ncbi:MAG: GNAT family N-acetyltransferase [Alphaproteobacteria bacterium]|nr:GNAT family N-acetyltransferase [Alphaproteobacteria bacterium]